MKAAWFEELERLLREHAFSVFRAELVTRDNLLDGTSRQEVCLLLVQQYRFPGSCEIAIGFQEDDVEAMGASIVKQLQWRGLL